MKARQQEPPGGQVRNSTQGVECAGTSGRIRGPRQAHTNKAERHIDLHARQAEGGMGGAHVPPSPTLFPGFEFLNRQWVFRQGKAAAGNATRHSECMMGRSNEIKDRARWLESLSDVALAAGDRPGLHVLVAAFALRVECIFQRKQVILGFLFVTGIA